ncbi:PREDICTED: limulus clotting factor C-like [Dinoponera quadriceps]|uniref:Limulus clotting factor C-like n=1 Tax=Dinoponera quadriceps TaxID=609295 RepID=A0A6P3YC45_DINQU|nr:PREDICTED: limulus clotting factor C-like [Dinoponera quadriceps]
MRWIVTRIAILFTVVCNSINSGYAQSGAVNPGCGLEMFQCHDGECIAGELLCDGKANCKDQSDETVTECTKMEILCPDYAFRCKYGACVNGDAVCNGIKDCIDNSDETLPQCTTGINNQTNIQCKTNEFMCDNGECIRNIYVCDGIPQCTDESDEVSARCGSVACSSAAFRCAYGACIDGDKRCNQINDCADGSDEDVRLCGGTKWPSPFTTVTTPIIKPTERTTSLPPVTPSARFCKTPSQPPNGHWKLHRSHIDCMRDQDCDIPEGMELQSGSYLVYSCNQGYEIKGPTFVSCSLEGKWLNIPTCAEIRCEALSTASVEARCIHNGNWVSCESPVSPRTTATLACRNSYRRESLLSRQRDRVTCNENGQWEPEPIQCVPVCGILPPDVIPLIVNGVRPNITEFPWHASMYLETQNGTKEYFCGASIIQENLLITAAHCVYDEVTKKIIRNPKLIHILTGNVFRDFDFPWHDQRLVRKGQVKNIYISCNYLGLIGNYVSDIAILELVEPFVLSTWLVPICIDPFSYGDRVVLEAGVYGKVAGFGRTAMSESSAILQALTVPYVPYNQCKSASQNSEKQKYITIDKFCAGYTNGSSVCNGDSGGGLVFKTGELWYLRGVVSVALNTIEQGASTYCDNNVYSLYTRISSHVSWIEDVIERLGQKGQYPLCPDKF